MKRTWWSEAAVVRRVWRPGSYAQACDTYVFNTTCMRARAHTHTHTHTHTCTGVSEWQCICGQADGSGTLLARHAHLLHSHWSAAARAGCVGCAACSSASRHSQWGAQGVCKCVCDCMWDAPRAALPAGAHHADFGGFNHLDVRAMQIIDDLEVAKRGPYGGGVGHVSFSGEGRVLLS
eukprot:1158836-Pelagomonas_calceolata.AAC.10